ncbi:MAG: transposase family protein [Hyphomicrobiales bacterium]|nr:transposase family protein [Hyphomicrobiales bacterium]
MRSQAAVACDFAPIDTALLRRYYLRFFIDITARELFLAGVTTNPTGQWTTQAARNLFLRRAGTLTGTRALVHDRGSQFTHAFDEIFRAEEIEVLKTSIRAPVTNTFAERWIGSLRRGLLDRTIIWNQRQLERIVVDCIAHYNHHRPLDPQSPRPEPHKPPHPLHLAPRVTKTTRCHGLINGYRNAA